MAIVNPYNYKKPANAGIVKEVADKKNVTAKKVTQTKQDVYLKQKVMSARPEELTLMLYEGLVRFIKLAEYYVAKSDIQKTNENAKRAQDIVSELKITLNQDIEISSELDRLYDFILDELVAGNIKKDQKRFANAREIAEQLVDMWKNVMKSIR